jgi:hypothetical protein
MIWCGEAPDEPVRAPLSFKKTVDNELSNSEDAACERCGSFEAMEFAGKILCHDCVALAACGCACDGSGEN